MTLWLSTLAAGAATPYERLTSFGSQAVPGKRPYAGLVQGQDGALYGTTLQGGTNNAGTVFKLNKDGSGYQVLHHFRTNGVDGQSPLAIIQGNDSVLYGATSIGGTNNVGTVFKLHIDGTGYVELYQFGSISADGQNPQAGLMQGSDGLLYGTTFFGGSNSVGTAFKLSTNGAGYTLLRHFGFGGSDGEDPDTALLEGTDRLLYGATQLGGSNTLGTLFKINRDGGGYAILHHFAGGVADGSSPNAALIQATDGGLYGTTFSGGSNNVGTVFTLNTNGTSYSLIHNFDNTSGDGGNPLAALLEGRDGLLYGTTYSGGHNHVGTVFMLHKNGSSYTIFLNFNSTGGDGENPRATLVLGGDGAFYGTTWSGGDLGLGTVFRLLPPETPNMLDATVLGQTVQVRFAGINGFQYQMYRSTNLVNWAVLGTTTIMPASGIATNVDNTPPNPAAHYRAAWVP